MRRRRKLSDFSKQLRLETSLFSEGWKCKMKSKYLIVFCGALLFIFYNMQNYQHEETMMEQRAHPFDTTMVLDIETDKVGYLPDGILHSHSDLEMSPLWFSKTSQFKQRNKSHQYLLAMPPGINQTRSVNSIVSKRISQLYYFIMMGVLMIGMISSGVKMLSTYLLSTRLNGSSSNILKSSSRWVLQQWYT